MTQLFSNNASSTLAIQLLVSDTSLEMSPGTGILFPTTGAGDFFVITLENSLGELEICNCTSRSGDTLVIVRAQQGTTARQYEIADRVEQRLTAGDMARFMQKDAPSIDDDLNLNGNAVINGEIVDVPIRSTAGDTANEIVVPAAGARPTIGGADIALVSDQIIPTGVILLWSGLIIDIPTGWVLCDGSSGTPNLKSRFVVGYDSLTPPFDSVTATGGNNAVGTGSAGAHTHTGKTGLLTLLANMVPTLIIRASLALTNFSSDNHSDTTSVAGGANGIGNGNASSTNAITYVNNSPVAHDHTISSEADHSHTTTLPAYMVLAYIMKIQEP